VGGWSGTRRRSL